MDHAAVSLASYRSELRVLHMFDTAALVIENMVPRKQAIFCCQVSPVGRLQPPCYQYCERYAREYFYPDGKCCLDRMRVASGVRTALPCTVNHARHDVRLA